MTAVKVKGLWVDGGFQAGGDFPPDWHLSVPVCLFLALLGFFPRFFYHSPGLPFSSFGKKKAPKPKLFGPDILGWVGGLPREGVGAKKFGMSFETQGNQTLCGIYPGILPGISQGCPKSLRKKVRVQFSSPIFLFLGFVKKDLRRTFPQLSGIQSGPCSKKGKHPAGETPPPS